MLPAAGRRAGYAEPMDVSELRIRSLAPDDSFEELTALLHAAYAHLAEMGLRYVATYQSADTTRRRAAQGECYVVPDGERLVATATLVPPGPWTGHGPELYGLPGIAKVEQFGVHPDWQRRGLGSRLLDFVEARAKRLGAVETALDTAEGAAHLIRWYRLRGYQPAGSYDWRPHTNYRSLLFRRRL